LLRANAIANEWNEGMELGIRCPAETRRDPRFLRMQAGRGPTPEMGLRGTFRGSKRFFSRDILYF
jgi:hypothetical protein